MIKAQYNTIKPGADSLSDHTHDLDMFGQLLKLEKMDSNHNQIRLKGNNSIYTMLCCYIVNIPLKNWEGTD